MKHTETNLASLGQYVLLVLLETVAGKSAQSFTLWQKAILDITCYDHSSRTLVAFSRSHVSIIRDYKPRSLYQDHSVIAYSRHIYNGCYFSRTSRPW